ncbi:MAG: restriction endonuclease subunit S, partial [Vibrionaceae bacterium]
LFSRRGDVSRFALIDEKSEGALCGTGCLKARPSNNHSSRFLAYYLQLDRVKKWLEQNSVGQTMPNMNTEILGELPLIAASSKHEEEKIAQILATWDKSITTTERLLELARQQKKALMQQLLTGKKRLLDKNGVRFSGKFKRFRFADLVEIDRRSLDSKTDPDFEFDYISLSDVEVGTISSALERHLFKTSPSRARRVVSIGDILLATVRPNLQAFAKIKEQHEHCIASTGFAVLTAKKGTYSDYIYHYLFSSNITSQINSLVVGTNYPAINSSDISGLYAYCPDYEEQQKIAAVLSAADEEIAALQSQLEALKQEKKALMQQLLTGKRRVKVCDVA